LKPRTKYIIKFFNKNTNEFIGYKSKTLNTFINLSKNIDDARIIDRISDNFDLKYIENITIENIVYTIYKLKEIDSLQFQNIFSELKIDDITFKIVEFEKELRLLKIKKLL
jgi:hypothetical protein